MAIVFYAMNEKAPQVQPSNEADLVAEKMLKALNKEAFDSLKYLHFEFRGEHKYLWHKPTNQAIIDWADNRVIMDLDSKSAIAYKNKVEVVDNKQELIDKAWNIWCNDSFWMVAPFKVFDSGTTRSIVMDSTISKTGLMVEYTSGGVTPGDKYLWLLDENYIPTSYKMWVDIIPIGGLEATWEGWKTLKGGSKLATRHKIKGLDLELTNVKEANSFSELGYEKDPFAILVK